jgi:hypothetical protein
MSACVGDCECTWNAVKDAHSEESACLSCYMTSGPDWPLQWLIDFTVRTRARVDPGAPRGASCFMATHNRMAEHDQQTSQCCAHSPQREWSRVAESSSHVILIPFAANGDTPL